MNRNLSEVSRLTLKPILALAMVTMLVVSFALDAVPVQAQGTYSGDYCIEGLVIDHEEKPLAGWTVTITDSAGNTDTEVSADGEGDLKKGMFRFDELFTSNGMTETVMLGTGTYTATLTMMDGYEEVTPATFSFPLRSNMMGCAKIRFKVRLIREVEVYKIDRNHELLEGWTIIAKPAEGNVFAEQQTAETDENGLAVFTLTKGAWIFMERPPNSDDAFRPIVPPGGKLELNVESGQPYTMPYTLVFKNELLNGCIEAYKFGVVDNGEGNGFLGPVGTPTLDSDSIGYPVAGWGFKLLRMDHSVVDIKHTDGRGIARFSNLPFGPYLLVEEDRPGWSELGDRIREINVDASGDCVEVLFENVQDESGYAIEGRKLDANGYFGLAGWEIRIKPLDKGGYISPTNGSSTGVMTTTTNGLGEYRFEFPDNDYRIPGAKFEICEVVQDGWEPLTPTCQIVMLPDKPMAMPVKAKDFINQQIGHGPAKPHQPGKGEPGKGDGGKGDGYCSTYHVVKAGEGLFSIGTSYGVSAQAMLNANPSVRSNTNYWVYVGQRLCIP